MRGKITKPISCLVTGSAGFVGSNLTDALVAHDYDCYGIDNLTTGKKENLNPKATFIESDINDINKPEIADQIGEVDYIFHTAALARIQPSIQNPISSHHANVTGTLQVLEYAKRVGAKVIFSGSSSIYAGEKVPIAEDDLKAPKSPYALQKLQCEEYLELYSKLYNLDYVTLRYFNVFGERMILEGAYAAVVGIFLNQKAHGQSLTITGDGEQRRDMTYVGDVVIANMMAMSWPRGAYNIGTGKNYSINDIAEMVGGEKQYIEARKGEARQTLADNYKARALGWQPTMDVETWLEKNFDS